MPRDRHDRTDLFAMVPQLGLRLEPQRERLDRLLDDDNPFDLVRGDLAGRHPETRCRGRPSTPVEVIFRMLMVMRLYRWSCEQVEHFGSATTAGSFASPAGSISRRSPTIPT